MLPKNCQKEVQLHLKYQDEKSNCLIIKLSRVYENYGYLIYKQKNGEEVNQVDIDVKEEEISLLRNKIDVLSDELEEYKQNNKF